MPRRVATGRSWGQRLVITSGALVAGLAMVGALVVGVAWWRIGSFERIDLDLTPRAEEGPLNFLLVGSDSRDHIATEGPDAEAFLDADVGGERADTVIVLRIEPKTNEIKLLSIPRDLWVPLNGTGPKDRINAAFAEGGAQGLINTVRATLDIEINHYVEVDFVGFRSLVDIIGGVPMYFDRPMYDEYSGLDVPAAGCVVLKGQQALAFARARHLVYVNPDTGRYEEDLTADLGRITRQQVFLRQTLAKLTSLGLSDVSKLSRMISVAADNVTFDDALSNADLIAYGRHFASVGLDALQTYSLPTDLHDTPGGASVLLLKVAEAQPVLDVFRGLSQATPTTAAARMAPGQIAVSVLNGTGVDGQASEAAEGLRAIGFTVAQVGNSPVLGEVRTTVRFAADAQTQAQVLASYLPAGVNLVEDRAVGTGVVLVTGADFVGIAVPEKDIAGHDGVESAGIGVGMAPPRILPAGVSCH